MTGQTAERHREPLHGEHGTPSEVSWDSGTGRQPYSNQGVREGQEPSHGEFVEGDRGELSGRNLQQLEEVWKMP